MKFFLHNFLISTIFFLVFSFSSALTVDEISATDYVTDYTQTLSADQILELSTILGNIEKQNAYQIAVVIVPTMNDQFGRADYIEHFATKLYEKLGLGTKEKDEGMLWLISKDTHEMRMEVGYGLEPILTDGVTKNIQDNFVRPFFKTDDYFGGVKTGIENINMVLGGGQITDNTNLNNISKNFGNFFEIFIFLFFIFIQAIVWFGAVMARTKSWWLGGVVGAVLGSIIYFLLFTSVVGVVIWIVIAVLGTLFDFLISKNYKYHLANSINSKPSFWSGGTWGPGSGGFGGRGGSGFGGFGGGGMSGGGGSSSSW